MCRDVERALAKLAPVLGRHFDTPDIARLIKSQSNEPKLLVLSNRNTIYDSRSDDGSRGKTLQPNCDPDVHWMAEPECTSLGVYEDRQTRLGKRLNPIQTGNNDRKLE